MTPATTTALRLTISASAVRLLLPNLPPLRWSVWLRSVSFAGGDFAANAKISVHLLEFANADSNSFLLLGPSSILRIQAERAHLFPRLLVIGFLTQCLAKLGNSLLFSPLISQHTRQIIVRNWELRPEA